MDANAKLIYNFLIGTVETLHVDVKTGSVSIVPRSDGLESLVKGMLTKRGVKFSVRPGFGFRMIDGMPANAIVFDLGQNPVVDVAVRELADGDDLLNLSNYYLEINRYNQFKHSNNEKLRDGAIDELKRMIGGVRRAQSRDDGLEYYYLYFPTRIMERAETLLNQLGAGAEHHISYADGRETPVLRVGAYMISGDILNIINQLVVAATAHQQAGILRPGSGRDRY